MHESHWRSLVRDPGCDWPVPAGQVLQVTHWLFPAVSLNWPCAQDWQSRSEATDAGALKNIPAPHGALTAVHCWPFSAGEKVAPASHAPQRLSSVADPATVRPWPAGHVDQDVHAWLPVTPLNWPSWHSVQEKSALSVAAMWL